MFKILLSLSMAIFFFCSKIKHPLMLGSMILSQTFFICMISRSVSSSSWIMMTIFLIMVGGLMIIFIYMTSVCSNEIIPKWTFSLSQDYHLLLFTPIFMMPLQESFLTETLFNLDLANKEFIKMFLPINVQSTIFTFLYLLIILIILINLLELKKGPMRKKY